MIWNLKAATIHMLWVISQYAMHGKNNIKSRSCIFYHALVLQCSCSYHALLMKLCVHDDGEKVGEWSYSQRDFSCVLHVSLPLILGQFAIQFPCCTQRFLSTHQPQSSGDQLWDFTTILSTNFHCAMPYHAPLPVLLLVPKFKQQLMWKKNLVSFLHKTYFAWKKIQETFSSFRFSEPQHKSVQWI